MFTFFVKLEIWSFHVADLPRTGKKGIKMKNARPRRAKTIVFAHLNMQICEVTVAVADPMLPY